MADKFVHPLGKKSQKVGMRGGRLIRKTSSSPSGTQSTDENIRRQRAMLEEAAEADYGRRSQKRSGVSGYKTPKGQVEEGLEEAGSDVDKEVPIPKVVPYKP